MVKAGQRLVIADKEQHDATKHAMPAFSKSHTHTRHTSHRHKLSSLVPLSCRSSRPRSRYRAPAPHHIRKAKQEHGPPPYSAAVAFHPLLGDPHAAPPRARDAGLHPGTSKRVRQVFPTPIPSYPSRFCPHVPPPAPFLRVQNTTHRRAWPWGWSSSSSSLRTPASPLITPSPTEAVPSGRLR